LPARIAVPTPTWLVSTVIGIDSSSGRPTGSSQTSALKRCRAVGGQRGRGIRYLFHSCLRTVRLGFGLISYLNMKEAASVFAAYCGIALQETRVWHRTNYCVETPLFYTEKYE
jgi:hypothetical protein